jgi:tetratricopeptide (TPR) repeat protein
MEQRYIEAIKASPGLLSYGSYAQYLDSVGEFAKAGDLFLQALASVADPHLDVHTLQNYALYLGFYGSFLETSQSDSAGAEIQYLKALEHNPNDPLSLGNYAVMLHRVKKDYKQADEYYKRAIQAYPNHASILGKYANFLKHGWCSLSSNIVFDYFPLHS